MAQPVSNQLRTSGSYANKPLDERYSVNRYYASDDDAENSIKSIQNMSGAYIGLHVYVTDLEKNGTDKRGEYVITKLTFDNDVDMSGVKTLQEYVGEQDPQVYDWAKQPTKPSYNASEVGAVPDTRKVNNKSLSSDIQLTPSDIGAQPTIDNSHKLSADNIADGNTNKVVTQDEKTIWNGKQDALTPEQLSNIAKGGTALQPAQTATGLLKNDGTVDTKTAGKADSAVQPVTTATANNFVAFNENGNIKDSGCNESTFIKGVKQNGTSITPVDGVVNITMLSAYEQWLDENDYDASQHEVNEFLEWLKAHISKFIYEAYDDDAAGDISDIGDVVTANSGAIGNTTPSANTKDAILLMPNAASSATATMMFATIETSTQGVYKFVYVGSINDLDASTFVEKSQIVNDLTTGGINKVLSAEAGKVLNENINSFTTDAGGEMPNETFEIGDEYGDSETATITRRLGYTNTDRKSNLLRGMIFPIARNKKITSVTLRVAPYKNNTGDYSVLTGVRMRLRKDTRDGEILATTDIDLSERTDMDGSSNEVIAPNTFNKTRIYTVDKTIEWRLGQPIEYDGLILLEFQFKGSVHFNNALNNDTGRNVDYFLSLVTENHNQGTNNDYEFPLIDASEMKYVEIIGEINEGGSGTTTGQTTLSDYIDTDANDYVWNLADGNTSVLNTNLGLVYIPWVRYTYAVNGKELKDSSVGLAKLKSDVKSLLPKYTPNNILSQLNKDDVLKKFAWLKRRNYITSGDSSTYTARDKKVVTLMYFSDIHGNESNMRNLILFRDEYSEYLDDCICTGDIVQTTWYDGMQFWTNSGADRKVLMVIGNHDFFVNQEQEHPTNEAVYNRYMVGEHAIDDSLSGVVRPDGAGSNDYYPCYYYKDYSNSDLRIIVLDASPTRWDSTQEEWLSDILEASITDEKHVMIISHYIGSEWIKGIDSPFNSQENTQDNYNGDWIGTYHGATSSYNFNCKVQSLVADFVEGGGKFVGYVGGHAHRDYLGLTTRPATGGYNFNKHETMIVENNLTIAIDCAKTGDTDEKSGRWKNESSEVVFNIISVDTDRCLFKVQRIGRDRDLYGRHIDSLCWDYSNHRFIDNNVHRIHHGVTRYIGEHIVSHAPYNPIDNLQYEETLSLEEGYTMPANKYLSVKVYANGEDITNNVVTAVTGDDNSKYVVIPRLTEDIVIRASIEQNT